MSHYAVLVLIESDPDITTEDAVSEALERFKDQEWDWFQIGGRWSGHFDGYKPEEDPANIETCDLCLGTGTRPGGLAQFGQAWFDGCNGCNGCAGKGKKARWPTEWASHPGDVKPVSVLTATDTEVYAVCVEGSWFGGDDYQPWLPVGEMFQKRELPPLEWLKKQYPNYMAVIVDCHN